MKAKPFKLNNALMLIYIIAVILSLLFVNMPAIYSQSLLVVKYCCFLILAIFNWRNFRKKDFLLALTFLALAIPSTILTGSPIRSFLDLVYFVLGFTLSCDVESNKRNRLYIWIGSLVVYIYYAYLSLTVWQKYLDDESIINPNSLAKYLFVLAAIISAGIKKKSKLLAFLFCIVSMYFMYMTSCRSVVIAFALYTIVRYIPLIKSWIIKYERAILYGIVLVGCFFPGLYVSAHQENLIRNTEYLGKNLYTGRQMIWGEMLGEVSKNPSGLVLGYGVEYQASTRKITNYHNWYFGTIFAYGLIPSILYFATLINLISKISRKDSDAAYFFVALFIVGLTEFITLWEATQSLIVLYAWYMNSSHKKELEQ